ncbi:hypothetical protein AB5N19_08695 [Seiridium cardinale]
MPSRSSSKRSQNRIPKERRNAARNDHVLAVDKVTGEEFHYPRNPNNDTAHMEIVPGYGAPKPGYRYGYDRSGKVVSFRVAKEAEDHVPRAAAVHSKPAKPASVNDRHHPNLDNSIYVEEEGPSRSKSRRDAGRPRGLDRRHSVRDQSDRYSHRGKDSSSRYHGRTPTHDYAKEGKSKFTNKPYEVSSPPESPRLPQARTTASTPADLDWEIETVIETIRRL